MNAQQPFESIDKGVDNSASDSDDSIELRLETSDEEAKEIETDEDETQNNLTPLLNQNLQYLKLKQQEC